LTVTVNVDGNSGVETRLMMGTVFEQKHKVNLKRLQSQRMFVSSLIWTSIAKVVFRQFIFGITALRIFSLRAI